MCRNFFTHRYAVFTCETNSQAGRIAPAPSRQPEEIDDPPLEALMFRRRPLPLPISGRCPTGPGAEFANTRPYDFVNFSDADAAAPCEGRACAYID